MPTAPCAQAAHFARSRASRFLIAALIVVLAGVGPRPAAAWQAVLHQDFELADDRFVQGVVDRDGLVFLVSRHRPGILGVRKVVATTGFVLWEREVAYAYALASAEPTVATDPDGNLLLALITDAGNFNQWQVAKLAGHDGRTLWRVQVLNPGNSDLFATVNALTVDPAGDVVVAGTIDRGSDESWHDFNFVVVKLDGEAGAELWRREIDGVPAPIDPDDFPTLPPDGPRDEALSVAVGPEEVYVAGTVQLAGDACFAVIELDGKDGTERRRITIPGDGVARAVRVAENGDVVAVGEVRDAAVIARRREDRFWVSRSVLPGVAGETSARGLALTPDGRAVVATRTKTVGFPARVDLVALAPDGLPAWAPWRLDAPFEADDVRRLAVDADGNVLVLGSAVPTAEAPGVPRMSIASVAERDGTVRWRRTFDGDAPAGAEGAAVLATPEAIVAAGAVFGAATSFDALAVGLAPGDGAERWRTVVGTPHRSADIARALAFDAAGDVVAAGDLGYELGVVKLSAAKGREQWRRTIGYGSGTGLAVASDGDVIAVGNQESSVTTIGRFDGETGDDRWRVQLSGYSSPTGLALASDDDVVVTSVTSVHRRRGTDGSPRWQYVAPIVDGNLTEAAIDSAGDVLAAGTARVHRPGPFVLAVVKLDGATGGERWVRLIPSTGTPGGGQAFATALTTDAAGDVFVTGGLSDAGTGFNFFVLKLRGSDGATLWQRHLAVGTGNSLAITAGGDVVVGGEVDADSAHPVATVLLLDGGSGAERWRRTIVGDAPARRRLWPSFRTFVALHPEGDVLAAAFVGDTTTESDFAVVRLDAAGNERWRRTLDGTSTEESLLDASGDYTTAIALDAAGNVAAAGVTVNEVTSEDFTVLRLPGDGGNGPVGAVLRCQRALASAGERLLRARLRFLARCRERETLDAVSGCADAALAPLKSALRSTIGRRCSDARLEALDACGATVAEVAGDADGEGCLVTANRAATDALFALLGHGAETSSGCRALFSRTLERHAVWTLVARQRCRETGCAVVPAEPNWAAKAFARFSRTCRQNTAGTCATSPSGLGRCLAQADRAIADALIEAQFGPRPPAR